MENRDDEIKGYCHIHGFGTLWVVCKHIVNGTTNVAWLSNDWLAACPFCSGIMPPEEDLKAMCEDCLKEKLYYIDEVVGLGFLAKGKSKLN